MVLNAFANVLEYGSPFLLLVPPHSLLHPLAIVVGNDAMLLRA